MTKRAKLRVCASCEWIFQLDADTEMNGCPKCGFGDYGAHRVYGNRAYRYAKNQKPWYDRMMYAHSCQLRRQIDAANALLF